MKSQLCSSLESKMKARWEVFDSLTGQGSGTTSCSSLMCGCGEEPQDFVTCPVTVTKVSPQGWLLSPAALPRLLSWQFQSCDSPSRDRVSAAFPPSTRFLHPPLPVESQDQDHRMSWLEETF